MRVIIGDYELTMVPKSLFSSDGSLLDGSKSKSDAVAEVLKVTEVEPTDQIANKPDCVVFDAMRVLNEMSTKRFKTGKDLSNEFLHRIDSISSDATTGSPIVKNVVFLSKIVKNCQILSNIVKNCQTYTTLTIFDNY